MTLRLAPFPLAALLGALALGAAAARAHGPTVELGADGPAPAHLAIAPGDTVHFQNRDGVARRVRGDDDAFTSPELAPGGGWHLRFPFPGSFAYSVGDGPEQRGSIAVGERGGD